MPTTPTLAQKLTAEFLGTFVLVFGGCGSAVLAAVFLTDDGTQVGIGFVGVALAFGLTVLTMAYAVGHVSGGHFNPAVTLGLAAAGDSPGATLRLHDRRRSSPRSWRPPRSTSSRAVETASPHRRPALPPTASATARPAATAWPPPCVIEVLLTAIFLFVILGATDTRAPKGFAPIAIGLALTLIHLVSIPVTNTSVNPARSIGPALFAGGDALAQLWVFLVAPVVGALIAGATYRFLLEEGEPASLEDATAG